jgi:TMEM175 potassium channel family protein
MTEPIPPTFNPPAEKETGRLEAFSDGVMAVIITIMAFELKAPVGGHFADLRHRLPALLVYVLSFAFIGIYWNNHHHLLRATTKVSGAIMWTNLHLLFWLSLIPVLTEWIGDSYRSTAPAATYATVALASALAFDLLVVAIVRAEGPNSKVATAIGSNLKGHLSVVIYAAAIGLAFVSPWISYALLASVSLMWFVPDRRLEH